MRKTILVITICILFYSCNNKKTELILLGTVHKPVKNFTPDSLYNILSSIEPDLILFEVDSSFFTKDFKFKKNWDSNENIATVKYMNNHNVQVRPYEFTGRNEYRIKIGSRPTDSKTFHLLDSLYKNNLLHEKEQKIFKEFLDINDSLNTFAYLGAKAFNNKKTDSIAQIRQQYHYKELLKIINNHTIFSNTFYVKQNNDSISYAKGYKRASEFWDLRNQTMSKNILHFVNEFKGKKIVVLNGYFHRYYLNKIMRPKQKEQNFIIREFYEY